MSRTPKTPTPKQDFNQHLSDEKKLGKRVMSDRRKSSGRVIVFDDGGELRLLTTGHMVHDYADGKKAQRNPDGKGITIDVNGTKIQENPNGNIVVRHADGTQVTHVAATGEKVFVYPDGTTKQVDPTDGRPPVPTPKVLSAKEDFNQRMKDEKKRGRKVVSDRKKTSGRVVEFDDGGKIRLLNTGHMVHDFADGAKFQRNPDGKAVRIEANGTKVQVNPNGNTVYQYMDGTQITHVSRTGEKIIVYPDGSTKQTFADGSGIIVDQDGERSEFTKGGDSEFERDRLARDKAPLDSSEENSPGGSSTEEEPDSSDDSANDRNNFFKNFNFGGLGAATKSRNKKRKNRRMVPRGPPQQAAAAATDNRERKEEKSENLQAGRKAWAPDTHEAAAATAGAVGSNYVKNPLEEEWYEPERCCNSDRKKLLEEDSERFCDQCSIM